ncbi:hypothetical protein ACRTDU_04475 [Sunxiuqinia elliptica]
MKILFKVLGGIRKGVSILNKANKALKTIEVCSKHINNMVDDVESIWKKEFQNELKTEEAK